MNMTMNSFQTIFPAGSKPEVRAKVVDHTLVATFRTSNPPIVWRMDLEKNHSFAVAIQKRDEDWELGVMSPKGDFTVVARFDDRAAVDQAMSEVEAAMFSNPNSTGIKVWRVSAMTAAMVGIIIIGYTLLTSFGTANLGPMANVPPSQVMAVRAPALPASQPVMERSAPLQTQTVPPATPTATAIPTPATATAAPPPSLSRGVPIDADTALGKE
jgi:hypothetical protein